MRVLIPRRIIGWGVLLAVLCLLPISSPIAFAKPIGYEDKTDDDPPAPKGDGDGVVVKASSIQTDASTTTVSSSYRTGWSWRTMLYVLRAGFSLRLYR